MKTTKTTTAGRYEIKAPITTPDGITARWFAVKGTTLGQEVLDDYGDDRDVYESRWTEKTDWTDQLEVTLANGEVVEKSEGFSYENGDFTTKRALLAFLDTIDTPTIEMIRGTAYIV